MKKYKKLSEVKKVKTGKIYEDPQGNIVKVKECGRFKTPCDKCFYNKGAFCRAGKSFSCDLITEPSQYFKIKKLASEVK